MAHTSRTIDVYYAVPKVWHFVSDMDNWAPLMPGYVSHEKINDRESRWKIRGDLGFISRVVEFTVTITEWHEPSPEGVIAFTLQGLNELVEGCGSFKIRPGISARSRLVENQKPAAPAAAGWVSRFYLWLFKLIRPFKTAPVRVSLVTDRVPGAPDQAAPTLMILDLELHPGGPMGKMVDKLIAPLLPPEAEGLALRILSEIGMQTKLPQSAACSS